VEAKVSTAFLLVSGLGLGWCLGANASANFFGTAVATNSVRYRTAIMLIAVFAIAGAVIEGPKLYQTYSLSGDITMALAFDATCAAAMTMFIVTYLSLPASASQAAVGGMMGISIWSSGMANAGWAKLGAWACCWAITPLSAALIAFLCMQYLGPLIRRSVTDIERLSMIYKFGLIAIGCYGAYTLGANNVVITTGLFFKAGFFGDSSVPASAVRAALSGGLSIALGALTYSRKVMRTVGEGITALDPFSALVAVFAHSATMHLFTQFHVPVSSSQAIVGAVAGVGISRSTKALNSKMLTTIICGWGLVPLVSGLVALLLAWITRC